MMYKKEILVIGIKITKKKYSKGLVSLDLVNFGSIKFYNDPRSQNLYN